MNDREFINMVINSYLSYAIDPQMATLNNTVANRLNDIADKLEKQKNALSIYENLMEKYNIKDVEELEKILKLFFMKG